MKFITPLTLASTLFISACTSSPQVELDNQAHTVKLSPVAMHRFQCESGAAIVATYTSDDAVTVQYKGSDYPMKIAVSASGARYVGGELEWWTKGSGPQSEGALFRHRPDGTTGDRVELCTEV
ncbi:MliC family protein [Alkalimarinus alittae]|uniref:MliC family protein n=1 Tax=Alkalimarinus alittae TaxID=2961619 RepID=A0ABY6N3X2_9ALTE|nr:MliC family protein [Alkalimarinus alittae]UZE96705.1 MliC family protein [Alkalimarinus alittae]